MGKLLNYNEKDYENATKFNNACFLTRNPLLKFDQPLYSYGYSTEHVGKPLPKFERLNWEQFPIQVIPGDILVFFWPCKHNSTQSQGPQYDGRVY